MTKTQAIENWLASSRAARQLAGASSKSRTYLRTMRAEQTDERLMRALGVTQADIAAHQAEREQRMVAAYVSEGLGEV